MLFYPTINPITFDNSLACDYIQPFERKDIISLQYQFDNTSGLSFIKAQMIDENGILQKSVDISNITTLANGYDLLKVDVPLYNIPVGYYRLRLFFDSSNFIDSNLLDIQDVHEGTKRIIYYSTRTFDHDVYWSYSRMMVRVHAELIDFKPMSTTFTYEDDPKNQYLVSGMTFKERTLFIGDNGVRIPEFFADKINKIFCCDKVKIEREYYTISEGATLEPDYNQSYFLAQYKIKLRNSLADKPEKMKVQVLVTFTNKPAADNNIFMPVSINDGNVIDTLNEFFEGFNMLINRLNTPYLTYNTEAYYFRKDDDIYLDCTDEQTLYATAITSGIIVTCVYDYGIKFIFENRDAEPELSSSNSLAYSQWDGEKYDVSASSVIGTNPNNGPNSCLYVCFDSTKTPILTGVAPGAIIKDIEGSLFVDTFDLPQMLIQRISSNLYKYCNGAQVYLTNNLFRSKEIDEIIINMANNAANTISVADLSGQIPAAPPTPNAQIGIWKQTLNIVTD